MPATYDSIASQTLTSNQTSITFSSIPSTYTDLILVINGKTNGTGGLVALRINFNSDTGNNYSRTIIYGASGSAVSSRNDNMGAGIITLGQNADNFGSAAVHLQNYSNTTTNKTFIARENRSNLVVYATVSLWRNTSAINSITLTGDSGVSLVSGSTLSLYGIKAA